VAAPHPFNDLPAAPGYGRVLLAAFVSRFFRGLPTGRGFHPCNRSQARSPALGRKRRLGGCSISSTSGFTSFFLMGLLSFASSVIHRGSLTR
jgi:hypothetical protein